MHEVFSARLRSEIWVALMRPLKPLVIAGGKASPVFTVVTVLLGVNNGTIYYIERDKHSNR